MIEIARTFEHRHPDPELQVLNTGFSRNYLDALRVGPAFLGSRSYKPILSASSSACRAQLALKRRTSLRSRNLYAASISPPPP